MIKLKEKHNMYLTACIIVFQDTLVHALPSDRPGFAKGFRKNIGGRWRRLVKRKPETETCAIPPELKDQLKTIYVY